MLVDNLTRGVINSGFFYYSLCGRANAAVLIWQLTQQLISCIGVLRPNFQRQSNITFRY